MNRPDGARQVAKRGGRSPSQRRTADLRPRPARTESIDDTISKALSGRVNVVPAKAIEMAGQLYSRGQFAPAARVCQQVIDARPGNADAHNILGAALAATGSTEKAMESIRRAIRINPGASTYYCNLGEILRQVGQTQDAEAALQEAIRLDPGNPQALNSLGIIQFEQSNFSDAEAYYRRALEALPEMAEASNNLGNALRMRGDIDGAIQAYQGARLALNEEPENPEALTLLGQVLHETDRYDQAIDVLEHALKVRPDNPETLNFYGVALKSVGRLEEARESILKALKLNDAMYGGYANLNDLVDFSSGVGEELFNCMEATLEAVADPTGNQFIPLHFAYAKALDDRRQHEKAPEGYILGGRTKRTQLGYQENEDSAFFAAIQKLFPK